MNGKSTDNAEKVRFKIPTVEEMEARMKSQESKIPKASAFSSYSKIKESSSSGSEAPSPEKATPIINNNTNDIEIVIIPSTSSSISPLKRSATSAFSACFSNLKKSAHYDENVSQNTGAEGDKETVEQLPPVLPLITGRTNSILINQKQRGNPILQFIRNVPYEFCDIVPDYVMGQTVCALFLSLRYHNLNPNYIHHRLKQLGKQYELRVLLVQIDVQDPHHSIKELTKIAILADCTLLLAWSPEEAGKYLETYKIFENKPPEAIMKKQDATYYAKLVDSLSSVRSINKSDAAMLLSKFQTLESIINASKEDLSFCPGIGYQKASKLYDALHNDFFKTKSNPTKNVKR